MAARKTKPSQEAGSLPVDSNGSPPATLNGAATAREGSGERYRPLPTGMHGLDPEVVKRDQRERLRNAMVELIAEKGYPQVRIVDLAKLARVSQPTFYSLFGDKEELFVSAYDEIARRTAKTAIAAYGGAPSRGERLPVAMRAFAELAAAEPHAVSLMVLGAFGAGSSALEHRNRKIGRASCRERVSYHV